MPFEYFAHTGDIGVRVWADSIDQLFDAAVAALVDAVTDSTAVQARETVTLSCHAPHLDLLLHDFLSDVLFHLDARELLPHSSNVSITRHEGQWSLQARLAVEHFDRERHPLKAQVKGITYHALSVDRTDEGWCATLVFDI